MFIIEIDFIESYIIQSNSYPFKSIRIKFDIRPLTRPSGIVTILHLTIDTPIWDHYNITINSFTINKPSSSLYRRKKGIMIQGKTPFIGLPSCNQIGYLPEINKEFQTHYNLVNIKKLFFIVIYTFVCTTRVQLELDEQCKAKKVKMHDS